MAGAPEGAAGSPPNVILIRFGGSFVELEMRAFILRANCGKVLDGLNSAIERNFKEAGIPVADAPATG